MSKPASPSIAQVRGAVAFFLVTFSTAFLMTVGARLTNWFTDTPKVANTETTGVSIMIAVVTLALGFSLRRMTLMEFRSALLGGAAVLLAISLSGAVNTDSLNDLEMLRWAGLAGAVANAADAVKREVDVIVADHNEGGVAEFIDCHVLA